MKGQKKSIHVLFTAAEADPYVKIGGLGDVAGSLPLAIRKWPSDTASPVGGDIRLVLPLHFPIRENYPLLQRLGSYTLRSGEREEEVIVYQDPDAAFPTYFLDGDPVQSTDTIYSSQDPEKYVFFSLALLKLPAFLKWPIDILHANDWHTALSVYALKRMDQFKNPSVRTILSVHNLPYLGEGCQDCMDTYQIPACPDELLPAWAYKLPLPMGLVTADKIIPVSPGYAREIQTPEFGYGLEKLLIHRADSVTGIFNGIDLEQWNPQTDPVLPGRYDVKHLNLKRPNKQKLVDDLGLAEKLDLPLLAVITRMDYQKGVDIVLDGLNLLKDEAWQMILLGSGNAELQSRCSQFEEDNPDRVRTVIGFKSNFSHQLYAGADIFLMPSRYEPCGISQMISMHYGTLPVAHATGGLKDTILPTLPGQLGTGYLYEPNTPEDFARALKSALNDYKDQKLWQLLQQNAMTVNFSWHESAGKYVQQYIQLVNGTAS